MDEELGIKANKKIVSEVARELSAKWHFKNNLPKNPVVLIVSGFQGSGKTTAINLLKKDLDLIVISPDEIRYKLFERGWEVSEQFVHTVNATRNNLLRKALNLGRNIAIDQLTTPARISLIQDIIDKNKDKKYKLLKIYLDASEEALIKRVESRQQLQGTYKGAVSELKESIAKFGKPNLSLYDLVLDSEELNLKQIAEKIEALI